MAIRSIVYDPKFHKELKDYESSVDPEDRFGEPKEYAQTKTFNMEYFSSITDPREARLYAHRRLQFLGQGSSRAVYVYNSKYALKIATNNAGIEQNRLEHNISEEGTYDDVIAKTVRADPNYNWIISELVRPLMILDSDDYSIEEEEIKEFDKYSPIPFHTMMKGIEPAYNPKVEEISSSGDFTEKPVVFPKYRNFVNKSPQKQEIERKIKLIKQMCKEWGLSFEDIAVPSNWGKTADGRMVILDFGYDEGIKSRYYTHNRVKNWEIDPSDYGVTFPIDTSIK